MKTLLPDAIAEEILAEHGVAGISDWITLTLDTAHDLGWRIVKLTPTPDPTTPNTVVVADEWMP